MNFVVRAAVAAVCIACAASVSAQTPKPIQSRDWTKWGLDCPKNASSQNQAALKCLEGTYSGKADGTGEACSMTISAKNSEVQYTLGKHKLAWRDVTVNYSQANSTADPDALRNKGTSHVLRLSLFPNSKIGPVGASMSMDLDNYAEPARNLRDPAFAKANYEDANGTFHNLNCLIGSYTPAPKQ